MIRIVTRRRPDAVINYAAAINSLPDITINSLPNMNSSFLAI
jgi:hypothetical protein